MTNQKWTTICNLGSNLQINSLMIGGKHMLPKEGKEKGRELQFSVYISSQLLVVNLIIVYFDMQSYKEKCYMNYCHAIFQVMCIDQYVMYLAFISILVNHSFMSPSLISWL